MKTDIYALEHTQDFSFAQLKELYTKLGVQKLFFKRLAANDNSKNQPYLAHHITELSFLPTGEITESPSKSQKPGSKSSVKFQASLQWEWVSPQGETYTAPNTKLIYYPQYPEVRLSGFLIGSQANVSEWMSPDKQGRSEGRVLFMGTKGDTIYAFLAPPETRLAKEIETVQSAELTKLLHEVPLDEAPVFNAKESLITELKRVYALGWINGQRLSREGLMIAYNQANGGGYTLEAELGIVPNGFSEPDFFGWELKQYAVKDFRSKAGKALTLMTPEPDGGIYANDGVEAFMRSYGYLDPERPNRINFNGKHVTQSVNAKTSMKLYIEGYDKVSNQLINSGGYVALIDTNGNIAAQWSYGKILGHWKKKHAKAAYIRAISQMNEGVKQYQFEDKVSLYQGTHILKFLSALSKDFIYYDPGLKLEHIDTKPKAKKRNQIRISTKHLATLYDTEEVISLIV